MRQPKLGVIVWRQSTGHLAGRNAGFEVGGRPMRSL
jgi:hypothetical protein